MILELDNKLIPELIKSYRILHFDEYPIVFFGKNHYGTDIIGSFIFDDDENDVLQFFICQISPVVLSDFLKKKISYKMVMSNATKIDIVTTDYSYNIEDVKAIKYINIESDILPSEESFCPKDIYSDDSKYNSRSNNVDYLVSY